MCKKTQQTQLTFHFASVKTLHRLYIVVLIESKILGTNVHLLPLNNVLKVTRQLQDEAVPTESPMQFVLCELPSVAAGVRCSTWQAPHWLLCFYE